MTVREAVPSDKGRVIRLLRDSRTGAGFDSPDGPSGFTFPFVAAYAERMFLQHCADPRALCLVWAPAGAQGVLMARAFEHPFGPVLMAQETMWWIDPAHRGGTAAVRMLDAYEAWARGIGCQFVGMAGMGDDPAVGSLYVRRGYRAAERNFLKPL